MDHRTWGGSRRPRFGMPPREALPPRATQRRPSRTCLRVHVAAGSCPQCWKRGDYVRHHVRAKGFDVTKGWKSKRFVTFVGVCKEPRTITTGMCPHAAKHGRQRWSHRWRCPKRLVLISHTRARARTHTHTHTHIHMHTLTHTDTQQRHCLRPRTIIQCLVDQG